MPTGACGINCDVCKLNLADICSTCGSGISVEGKKKLAAQERLLGSPCPVLACASMNHIAFCMRDCSAFPCENFQTGPYPFSPAFLQMQERRLQENSKSYTPDGSQVVVSDDFWDDLQQKDANTLCNFTLFTPLSAGQLQFRFLNEDILVDVKDRCLKRHGDTGWIKTEDPLLELATVIYLNNVNELHPLGNDIVGGKDLKEGHFFQGPHELRTDKLLERYGQDLEGLRRVAAALDGQAVDMADAAYKLLPFPRIPLYYLVWEGDEEFKPRATVLFDRSIEKVFAADAIWGLVNRVTQSLLSGQP